MKIALVSYINTRPFMDGLSAAFSPQEVQLDLRPPAACAQALAELAREEGPDEVAAAYRGNRPKFGPQYIIPVPFDPRLIHAIPPAVAQAAMDSGVAQRPIVDRVLSGSTKNAAMVKIQTTTSPTRATFQSSLRRL